MRAALLNEFKKRGIENQFSAEHYFANAVAVRAQADGEYLEYINDNYLRGVAVCFRATRISKSHHAVDTFFVYTPRGE